jgi:phage replication initiation protein
VADGTPTKHGTCFRCGVEDRLFQDHACWACTRPDEYWTHPRETYREAGDGAISPCSNTGQNALIAKRDASRTKPRRSPKKSLPGEGAIVDFLSISVPAVSDLVEQVGEEEFAAKLVQMVFGKACGLSATEVTNYGFQGYTHSAFVIDAQGDTVGRFGIGGEKQNDTAHISLTGVGTACVEDWQRVVRGLLTVGAKITRCDLAWDDVAGDFIEFMPRTLDAGVKAGSITVRAPGPGKPPKCRFVEDYRTGAGCSFYAGQKSHKELCVYEKGKQLGDPESPWVRVEVRFWNRRTQLTPEMLVNPLAYLRGAYNVCAAIPADVCTKLHTVKAKVEASAVAWARWMQTQIGKSVALVHDVFGEDADAYFRAAIASPGVPARFKGMSRDHLRTFIKTGLGHVGSSHPVGALA